MALYGADELFFWVLESVVFSVHSDTHVDIIRSLFGKVLAF